jgi:hypothetical protein
MRKSSNSPQLQENSVEKFKFLYDLSAAKSSGIAGNYLRFFLRENLN